MKIDLKYQHQVGTLTILSAVFAFASILLGAIAVEFELDTFSDPSTILRFSEHHEYAKWSMLFDMIGYYLLLLPVVFYLHARLQQKTPWASLLTFCGGAYVLIGAIGAAILAAVWPQQMQEYLTATTDQKVALETASVQITGIVYGGLWNILEVLLCGIWWIGTGLALRPDDKALGYTTIALGISTILDSLGNMFGWKVLAETGLNIYLILAIVWPIWAGISIYRGKL